jgi:hypothetical protein
MARNTSIDITTIRGLDSLCGSNVSTSDDLLLPEDRMDTINAPIPLPEIMFHATLSGIVTKLEGA